MTDFVKTAHKQYIGLSTDTKLTGVPKASESYEYDTKLTYITHDGTNWNLKSPPIDFALAISRGQVDGHEILRGLGERDSIGTTAQGEDLTRINELSATPSSPASDIFIPRPAEAGEQMTVISESDADNGGSVTGILTMCVVYLDSSGAKQETTVTLNGQAAVDLTPSDVMFVQEMYALTVGSNTVAEGHIRIYKKTDATLVYNMIAIGGNQSLVPHRMVPLGKTLHLKNWMGSEMSKSKRTRIRLRADCTNAIPPVRQADVFLFKSVMALDGSGLPFPLSYSIPALSVVKVSAWAQVSGAEIAIDWWGVLIDD